jgi:hypothetical protein
MVPHEIWSFYMIFSALQCMRSSVTSNSSSIYIKPHNNYCIVEFYADNDCTHIFGLTNRILKSCLQYFSTSHSYCSERSNKNKLFENPLLHHCFYHSSGSVEQFSLLSFRKQVYLITLIDAWNLLLVAIN